MPLKSWRRVRRILLAATIVALTIPAVASANVTVGVPGFNCSVTADTPGFAGGPSVGGQANTSCGGAQVHYSKQVEATLMQLVTGGWQQVAATGWSGWSTANPYINGVAVNCVPGRWYSVLAGAEISHNGQAAFAQANGESSGAKCP